MELEDVRTNEGGVPPECERAEGDQSADVALRLR